MLAAGSSKRRASSGKRRTRRRIDPIAPEALLRVGDVYADLWRRPELDPTYGQTALATYQELLNRYPAAAAAKRAQLRIAELNERFAYKDVQGRDLLFPAEGVRLGNPVSEGPDRQLSQGSRGS